MLLRVRSNVGLWRVDGLQDATATVAHVLSKISATRPQVVYYAPDYSVASTSTEANQAVIIDVTTTSPFSLDPGGKTLVDSTTPLAQQGLRHGSMLYCRVDPTTCVDISSVPSAAAAAAAAAATSGEGSAESSSKQAAAAAAGDTSTTTTASHMRRFIDKDGTVKLVPMSQSDILASSSSSSSVARRKAAINDKGFRPGMLALRDMKMSWTLNDFIALDSQFQFKIQRQPKAVCEKVSFDIHAISDFSAHAQRFAFSRKRIGYLYGKFVKPDDGKKDDDDKQDEDDDKKKKGTSSSSSNAMNVDKDDDDDDDDKKELENNTKVIVEAIYEPPQQVDATAAEGFVLLDDEREQAVEEIAQLLGLRKVGWIVAHEQREKGFVLSSAEVILAAEQQLEAAGGIEPTPFVTVTVAVRPPEDGAQQGQVSVEAFQVSQQCMSMVAEEALEVDGTDPKICKVSDTFTAIQEGKESKTVENSFFITVVPIAQHTSEMFVSDFPKLNRDLDDRTPSHNELKRQLQKASSGWTFVDRLADFNLLVYLSQFLDVSADFPKICASIVNREQVPLDDGYKILIKSMAGMDGSY